MADLIVKRVPENISVSLIVQADLLCYYIAHLNDQRWFPQTYIYDTRNSYELYYKMISIRHFEKVKILFGVKSIDELKQKLLDLREKSKDSQHTQFGYSASFNRVKPLYQIIDIEKIGTRR